MAETDQERTEEPTARRRAEARQQGNIARSMDLSAALSLLGAVLVLQFFGRQMLSAMKLAMEAMLSEGTSFTSLRGQDVEQLIAISLRFAVIAVGPVILLLTLVATLATVGQVGMMLSLKPLQPQISRLNPIKGLGNLVGMRAGMRLVMSLAKTLLIGGVAIWLILQDVEQILYLSQLDMMPMIGAFVSIVYWVALKLTLVLLLLGIVDYLYQKWQQEQDLKMTKQEVKDEFKSMEGDAETKGRRRKIAQELAMQRVSHAVPKADVIVTNPTHFAVALRYDSATMQAPKVIAKGADLVAFRIRQIASKHGVPVIERKQLARGLYADVEVGQEVTPAFYSAVAEILAYVYRLAGRKSA